MADSLAFGILLEGANQWLQNRASKFLSANIDLIAMGTRRQQNICIE